MTSMGEELGGEAGKSEGLCAPRRSKISKHRWTGAQRAQQEGIVGGVGGRKDSVRLDFCAGRRCTCGGSLGSIVDGAGWVFGGVQEAEESKKRGGKQERRRNDLITLVDRTRKSEVR